MFEQNKEEAQTYFPVRPIKFMIARSNITAYNLCLVSKRFQRYNWRNKFPSFNPFKWSSVPVEIIW